MGHTEFFHPVLFDPIEEIHEEITPGVNLGVAHSTHGAACRA